MLRLYLQAILSDTTLHVSNSRLFHLPPVRNLNPLTKRFPKRLIFTMVKNTDFLGNMETNPFYFRH